MLFLGAPLTQILLTFKLKIMITPKHHMNSPRLPFGYPFSTSGKGQGSILIFVIRSPSRQSEARRLQIRKLDVGGWDHVELGANESSRMK